MDTSAFLPLSPKEFHILMALADEPRNGYKIGLRVGENSEGRIRLSPATQFTILHRLVGKALIEEVIGTPASEATGRKQRFWTLSLLGRRVLRDEAERLATDAKLAMTLGAGP